MRIGEHPILDLKKGPLVEFEHDGRTLEGYEGETIAAALHAAGVRVLRHSIKLGRPRGFFCAIGRCSSCLMTVDGVPNVMTCVTPLKAGMRVETQTTKGVAPDAGFAVAPSDPDYPRDLGNVPLAIVGGGPAGLSAAIEAGRLGIECVVLDENAVPGGQLIKQTHMFFGSREHHARVRGIDIGDILLSELDGLPVRTMTGTTVLGLYPGRVLALLRNGRLHRLTADSVILATGASENMLAFPYERPAGSLRRGCGPDAHERRRRRPGEEGPDGRGREHRAHRQLPAPPGRRAGRGRDRGAAGDRRIPRPRGEDTTRRCTHPDLAHGPARGGNGPRRGRRRRQRSTATGAPSKDRRSSSTSTPSASRSD